MVPDCQDCGACCFTHAPEHVLLGPEDLDRLVAGGAGRLLKAVTRDSACLRTRDVGGAGAPLRTCVALGIQEGCFRCTIYEVRPDACRALERGSEACLQVHARMGARALAYLASRAREP